MLINLERLQKISELLKDTSDGWFVYSDEIKELYLNKDYKTLIDEFEEWLDSPNSNKKPQFTIVFYSSLLIIFYDDIKDIGRYIKDKPSLKFVKKGIEIFLKPKSRMLSYKVNFNHNYFKNKLRFMSICNDSLYDIEFKLRGIIYIFEMIYNASKNMFFKLLQEDNQNGIVVYFMVGRSLKFSYNDLVCMTNSTDEIKSFASFYYIMSKFSHLTLSEMHQLNPNVINNREIDEDIWEELNKLEGFMNKINEEKRISLIVSYIFEETTFPNFFIAELKNTSLESIINSLKVQDLNNLIYLVKFDVFIQELNSKEIECLFKDYFILWVRNESNKHIWDRYGIKIKEMINSLSEKVKLEIYSNLLSIKKELFITSFDREIRFVKYLKDSPKESIILDLLESS